MISGVEQAAELIGNSERAVAFTGAGISKSAGIPTYRDLDDGLYLDRENLQWAHRETFDADPLEWYVKFWQLYETIRTAKPTPAHYALKDMVEISAIDTVVTQNIDGLDLLAGTDELDVVQVHGHRRLLSCTDVDECGFFISTEEWLAGNDRNTLPSCPRDDKPLKPDVILFDDEFVPEDLINNFFKGVSKINEADTLLVIGTTLEIDAWNEAVQKFGANHEKPVVVINPNTSRADEYARYIIRAAADETLPAIRDQLIS